MALIRNEETQDAIEALCDDETIREWVHAVSDINVIEDLPDKTRDWVEGIEDLNNCKQIRSSGQLLLTFCWTIFTSRECIPNAFYAAFGMV